MASTSEIIGQLNQARELAFTSKESFPQVLRHIFNFVNNPNIEIQLWCAKFMKESFTVDESQLSIGDKIDLAIDAMDSLIILSNIKNLDIFTYAIDTAIVLYKLIFRYVADNDGCQDIWNKLNILKKSLIDKYSNNFPYEESFNSEINQVKNLHSKLELLKFVILVIDYQSKSSSNIKNFSLLKVNPHHTLIKPQVIEAESYALLDLVLKIFNQEILVPPLVTATLNHLSIICKRKPQFLSKICSILENFESNNKLQSNYQSIESFKLSKKYVDRTLRILINHLLRNQLVPPQFQSSLNKKLSLLINRGDEIRKKNILIPNADDSKIKKRSFEGFANPVKKLKLDKPDYKNLYCLNEPSNELNGFDLSTLPQNILISMTLAALNKINTKKLSLALDIIGSRYLDVINSMSPLLKQALAAEQQQQLQQQQQQQQGLPDVYDIDKLGGGENGESDDDDDDDNVGKDYNPQTVFTLPPPKPLSLQEKKDHINIIIKNFFKLSNREIVDIDNTNNTETDEVNGYKINKELSSIAIKSWKKNSWSILLTRLATRGMRNQDNETNELSDMIRNSIFEFFLDNIHTRIDLIIEWLNEEWYSEKVFQEEKYKESIKQQVLQEYEVKPNKNDYNYQLKLNSKLDELKVDTPNYTKWAGKVLDAMIPFLEPNDRKIFIRLLSDLPYLNNELVQRIKSLCFDPVRIKIGFLSLQFLIMYRPPVKQDCINILKELSESDQDDLKDESNKLLAKYT